MKRWIHRLASLILIVLAGIMAFIFAARAGWLTPDEITLRTRYALADSQYIEIDGETVHYADQGDGPAVVLVHGSFGSLRMWDDWADLFSNRFRVLRFDRPRMGLSGPAPAGRSGSDQELRIIAVLTRKLGIDRFFLVATSSAGVSAATYAAEHPQQVLGLVLANIAVGAFNPSPAERPPMFRFLLSVDPWFKGWRPKEFWRQVLLANFHEPGKVTAELAREWTELNNRAQRMPPAPRRPDPMAAFDRTAEDLERMSVPTLLLWSDHDHELPVETVGRRGLEILGSADKALEVVENCGHMMPLECGVQSADVAARFFDRVGTSQTY